MIIGLLHTYLINKNKFINYVNSSKYYIYICNYDLHIRETYNK